MKPISIQFHEDDEFDGVPVTRLAGEVLCSRIPKSIAKVYPHTGGGDYWFVSRLWVHPQLRRLRLGTVLLNQLVDMTNQFGISLVLRLTPMEKSPSRRTLLKFYRGYGFKPMHGSKDLLERA